MAEGVAGVLTQQQTYGAGFVNDVITLDATLIDPSVKARGTTFTADIDVLESMGSDKYAYFTIDSGRAANDALAELAADSGSDLGTGEMVARLSPESAVTKNSRAELVFDTDKIAVFDQQSGVSLRRR